MNKRVILVPCVNDSGKIVESVELHLDNLPPPDKLMNLLANEVYPFNKWFDLARAYLANGDEAAFIQFSTESITPDTICE